ncbi:DUF1631 family protein [Coralloluteibacterium stylophorae]|uniref:DUF1631 domain-containing protein n=1 Tax=Coralloluteibacterium stylophorae TaxID=1776034 RepID=A0A8J8AYF7_9GAMM|nr:DUF1631 family protein [Coralloluteibacterium stylophorae]MBS7458425.1 DUF1631 domain-containing protein [Coralloluteibacterium stylophorae]
MPASTARSRARSDSGSATLASQGLPRRVRTILTGLLEFTADEVERGLEATLRDFEQQLFKLAEQARNAAQQGSYFEAQRMVRRNRADLLPRYLIALEHALATVREPDAPAASADASARLGDLALVDTSEIDEATAIREIGTRAEGRAGLPVYFLGQRFGVLAGKPAFDAERLPIGPHALSRMLHETSTCLGIDTECRLLLLRVFERQALGAYPTFAEAANSWLCGQGVLPTLRFVPVRARPAPQQAPAEKHAAQAPADPPSVDQATSPRTPAAGAQATAATPGSAVGGAPAPAPAPDPADPSAATFDVLRKLLAGRRELIGKFAQDPTRGGAVAAAGAGVQAFAPATQAPPAPGMQVPAERVQAALGVLQMQALREPAPLGSVPRLKQMLLDSLAREAGDDPPPRLAGEDEDAIDLLALLFDHLMKDVRPDTPAAKLLGKLQIPLMRVALRDRSFFTVRAHPAREMLSNIAETGLYWLNEEDGDDVLGERLGSLVDRAAEEADGDPGLFETLSSDLSGQLQAVMRRAEVAERRHVEAARGKEKLALSRLHASEAMDALLAGRNHPQFFRSLLRQAWTDVMALTALRHGERSTEWDRELATARRLAELADPRREAHVHLGQDEADTLRTHIEQALAQVGYHDAEAAAIAQRLTRTDPEDEDPASRTELAMKLKARARLGTDRAASTRDAEMPALNDREQACLQQIRALPFGTWFDFVVNQQGDRVRRRLSWYSTVTGNTLFVNHRGQRVGEYAMDWLARSMAIGQVRPVLPERGNVVDRAWSAVVTALRSFAGRVPVGAGA